MAKLIALVPLSTPPSLQEWELRLNHASNQEVRKMFGEAMCGVAMDPRWRPLLYMVEVVALDRDVI